MRVILLGVLAVCASSLMIQSAGAAVVDVSSPMGAVGCYEKQDLADLLDAGHITRFNDGSHVNEVLAEKVKSKKCFAIGGNQIVFSFPERQHAEDAGTGIGVFTTRDGINFYAAAWSFQYAGETPTYAEPPHGK